MSSLRQGAQPFTAASSRCRRRARAAGPPPPVQGRLGGGSGYGGGSYGGGGYGGAGAGQGDGRLILPGQGGGAAQGGGRLIMPGQGGQGSAPGGSRGAPAVQQNFRPPPGFMDAPGRPQEEELGLGTDEMMNRLRAGAGAWHELAKLLPALQRKGLDAVAVEEATGIERRLQNVYDSVKASGRLSEAELAVFDDAEAEHLLYELRFLSVSQRVPAAAYILEQQLSPAECVVLARAIKEHERRKGAGEGFSDSPADCMAYKHYRDALECRKQQDVEACVRKGLEAAETDAARAKLATLLGESAAAAAALPAATLTVLRMTRDELGFRPIAVAGSLQAATAAAVRAAPKVSAEGVFGNFRVPAEGAGQEWVGLPNWSIVAQAANPVALTVDNCAAVPEIRAAAAAKTEEDAKRLTGVGLVVVDTAADCSSPEPCRYYLVETGGGRLSLAAGGAPGAAAPLAPVLFLCRPPARDGGAAGQTAELLSV
eukprot:scaffold4.g4991.t1